MATDPRFKYEAIGPATVSVAQIDKLMSFVLDSGSGTWGSLGAAFRILVVAAYVIAREKIVSAQAEAQKQSYEQDQAAGNQQQVDQDDLGSAKR